MSLILPSIGAFGHAQAGNLGDGTRRSLYTSSQDVANGLVSNGNITLPSTGYTVAFWLRRASGSTMPLHMYGSENDDDIIWLDNSTFPRCRYDPAASSGATAVTPSIGTSTWKHLTASLGYNISGSNDTILSQQGGTAVESNTGNAATETASGCLLRLLRAGTAGWYGHMFDICITAGIYTAAEMNYNSGSWKELDSTPLANLICRLDGQYTGDAGYDSTDQTSWTATNVSMTDSTVPPGANP